MFEQMHHMKVFEKPEAMGKLGPMKSPYTVFVTIGFLVFQNFL